MRFYASLQPMKPLSKEENKNLSQKILEHSKARDLNSSVKVCKEYLDKGYPSLDTLPRVLEVFSLREDIESIHELLEMVRGRYQLDAKCYYFVLSCCSKLGRTKEMMKYFNEMKDNSIETSEEIYNVLMDGFCRKYNSESVVKVFQLMQKDGVPPGVSTYNIILNSLSKEGKLKEILNVFAKMKEQGIVPSEVTYGALMESFGKRGEIDILMNIVTLMRGQGMELNSIHYSIMLKAFGEYGHLDRMEELFLQIYQNGVRITPTIYGIVLTALAKLSDKTKFRKVLEMFLREDCGPTVTIISTMMNYLGPAETATYLQEYGRVKPYEAGMCLSFFSKIREQDLSPALRGTFLSLQKKLQEGKYEYTLNSSEDEDFGKILQNIRESKGTFLKVDNSPAIISENYFRLLPKLEFNECQRLLEKIRSEKISLNIKVYNSIIQLFAKNGNEEILFKMMKEDKLKPDLITYSKLFELYSENGDSKILHYWNQMKSDKILPDTLAYNYLLKYYALSLNCDAIESVRKKMKKNKLEPDTWTYNCILTAYQRCGQFDKCFQLYQEINRDVGCTTGTVTIILEAIAYSNKADLIETVLVDIKNSFGLNHPFIVFQIARTYAFCGQLEKAIQVIEFLLDNNTSSSWFLQIFSDINKEIIPVQARGTYSHLIEVLKGYKNETSVNLRKEVKDRIVNFIQQVRGEIKPDSSQKVALTWYDISELIELVNSGNYHGAEIFFKYLQDTSFPNIVCYNLMLKNYANQKKFNEVLSLLKEMKEKEIPSDLRSNINILQFLEQCDPQEVDKYLEQIKQYIRTDKLKNLFVYIKKDKQNFLDLIKKIGGEELIKTVSSNNQKLNSILRNF